MSNEKVDVVIVGAGASGSVYASVLAKAGKKVVLLESGPDWVLADLISSEIWGRRIKPAGAPIVLEGKNPMTYAAQGGWGVGGAALHYFANLPRLLPTDFRIKSEHNRASDWPISYQDVAPFYDKVAREILTTHYIPRDKQTKLQYQLVQDYTLIAGRDGPAVARYGMKRSECHARRRFGALEALTANLRQAAKMSVLKCELPAVEWWRHTRARGSKPDSPRLRLPSRAVYIVPSSPLPAPALG